MGKGDGGGEGTGEGIDTDNQRIGVPEMPFPMAVVCCVINFLMPGFGTIIAGFTYICCPNYNDTRSEERCGRCFASCAVGFFQIFSTFFCLVGLIWSWIWGILFIKTSSKYDNRVGTNNNVRITSQQPHSVIATNSLVYTPQPGQGVATTNQSGFPLQHTNTGSTAYPPVPPPYPGLPSGPTGRDLYPPVSGANNPAFPPEYNKLPPV